MSPPRDARLVELRGGPAVVLVILSASDLAKAERHIQSTSATGTIGARMLDLNAEGIRRSIRKVGDRDVAYTDLLGEGLEGLVPRTRHRLQLGRVWSELHSPSREQEGAFRASIAVAESAAGETWRATLPDGRVVTMCEPHESTVREAVTAAEEGRSNIAGAIEAGRRHIIAIDHEPIPEGALAGRKWDATFSAIDTVLVGVLFGEATGIDEAPAVGNLE